MIPGYKEIGQVKVPAMAPIAKSLSVIDQTHDAALH